MLVRDAPDIDRVATTVSSGPSDVGPLNSRLIAKISIANPDGLVEVGGAVWVRTDDGRVVRVDPRTDTVTGTVHLDTAKDPGHYCQGIGTDGTAVWACTASDSTTSIMRIDPTTMATGKPVAVQKAFDQLSLPHTPRGLWVLTGTGTAVIVVDPTSQATTSYPLGARCQQLAASTAVVVATCVNDNVVVALNPATGRVLTRVSLPAPRIAAATGYDVWVDTTDGLTRLGSDQLTSSPPLSGGSLLLTSDALWASANDEGVVLHLRPTR
jgi:hypothetical protein